VGCATSPDSPITVAVKEVNPWTHLEFEDDPDNFQFAIVTDRTGSARPGIFEDAVTKLNLLRPEFVVSVGDLIQGGTENRERLAHEWDEFNGFVDALDMPFFYLPGNHDIGNAVMHEEYEKRFGRTYYHFVYRDVLFLCLNSEDPPPTNISETQAAYVEQVLADHPNVRWTLVFLHKPLWDYPSDQDNGWGQIEKFLNGRRHTVFAGHRHRYINYVRNDSNYITLATTGGGSALRGALYGEFDHVVWITMNDQGPYITNLMLDGIWDHNIRPEDLATLIDPVIRGTVVRPERIMMSASSLTHEVAKFRITNDADIPMHIEMRMRPPKGVTATPETATRIVPPNSFEFVEVDLRARRPVPVQKLTPLVADWTVSLAPKDRDPLVFTNSSRVVIDGPFTVGRAKQPITVDGQLGEWGPLPYECTVPAEILHKRRSWTGPEDSAFWFNVAYDENYLYVAIAAEDDEHVYRGDATSWMQDNAEVFLDARPPAQRKTVNARNELVDYLYFAIAPATDGKPMIAWRSELWPAGTKAKSMRTATGHTTEIAIPVSYLNDKFGGEWQSIRLNVCINDHDGGERNRAEIWWRPDWTGRLDYPDAGTFKRQ
jgi:3',5'-cyclic AMP phosphodiesterase CpdA